MRLHIHDWRPYYARQTREVEGFICDLCGAIFVASDNPKLWKEMVELFYRVKYEDDNKEHSRD
jgi:hypothetical protein